MNILDAARDSNLFGSIFRGDSWKVWFVFLAVLFGLPLNEEARVTYQNHTGRIDPTLRQFREAFLIAGRRSGKSLIAALVAVFVAVFRDYSEVLAPGEVGTVMVIASDRRQAGVIFGYVSAFFEIPILARMVLSRTKETIELSNRIRIEVHTCSFRAVRGYTVIAAILDELAFWRDETSASPDREVLTALRPAMATIPNALLLGVSSPYAKRGVLFDAFRDHYGKSSDVLVWKAASGDMNPTLSHAVVASAYMHDAAAARAEYGADFRDDVESFISSEAVEARVIAGRYELPFSPGRNYVGFCDPSGGRADSMTLAISHVDGDIGVLDCLREIQAPFSPESACTEFAGVLKRYGLSEVTGDKYAGEWPREQFEKRGIAYRSSEKTRSELYQELLPSLMSGQVQLLDNSRLIAQLVSLERRTGRGRDAIDHAPGAHDDLANSAAGAIVLALPKAGVFGVLELLKSGWDGFLTFVRSPASGAEPVGKTKAVELEKELRGLKTTRPESLWKLEIEPCPACKSPATVTLGGAGKKCNQCGVTWGPKPIINRAQTRGDWLRRHLRTRG